jgi:hypothetical protein
MIHHPICNCNGSWTKDADKVFQNDGSGGYLYLDRCPECEMYPWWAEANDQHMEALREMNQ